MSINIPAILRILAIFKKIELVILVLHFAVFGVFLYETGVSSYGLILAAGSAVWLIHRYWFHLGRLARFSPLARRWVLGSTLPLGLIGFRFITAGAIFLPLQMVFFLNLLTAVYLFLPSVNAKFRNGQVILSPVWSRNAWIGLGLILLLLLGLSDYDRKRMLHKYWEIVMKTPLPSGVTIRGGHHSSFMDYLVWMQLKMTPEAAQGVLSKYKLVQPDQCAQILKYKFEERKEEGRFFCYHEDSEERGSEIFYDKRKDIYFLSAWG